MKDRFVITQTQKDHAMPSALAAAHPARRTKTFLFSVLKQALALHRQRSRLVLLDDRLLRDIGLTREDALAEARRAVWDVPTHWRG